MPRTGGFAARGRLWNHEREDVGGTVGVSDVEERTTTEQRQQARAKRRLTRDFGRSAWIRMALVALIDAFLVLGLVQFISNRSYAVAALMVVVLALVNWAYLNPKAQASRWLTPGLALMLVFVVYPVLYTAYLSFTNYQTGNLLDRDQAIERLERVPVRTGDVGATLQMAVYRSAADELALLVAGEGVEPFIGIPRPASAEPSVEPVADLSGETIDLADPPAEIAGYELLTGLAVTAENRRLESAVLDLPGGSSATVVTLSTARVQTGGLRFTYDPATDTLFDAQTDRTCRSGVGTFYCDGVPEDEVQAVARLASDTTITCEEGVCDDVPLFALDQSLAGWKQVVGFDNYADIFGNDRIRAPFVRVLLWNIVFAAASVMSTFILGLTLALALKNENMRGRSVYRSIYIVPYAMPAFLSIFVWAGLLNTQNGQINGMLGSLGIPEINWLGGSTTAMISVLLVNLWLGFPYMFLINSGALTSIPEELIEAAKVDGAGAWKTFRMVTLPLLLVSTAPLLIGSFAFNFNNFALIYLLTDGGPPLRGYDVPVGATDILISFTFDIAAGAGRGSQYSLASAIVVIIFVVLATTSALSFRLTKKLEDIYDQ
jgi:arabinogalactan oligomer / maltooligosaccharide transport system permease protein